MKITKQDVIGTLVMAGFWLLFGYVLLSWWAGE